MLGLKLIILVQEPYKEYPKNRSLKTKFFIKKLQTFFNHKNKQMFLNSILEKYQLKIYANKLKYI